MRAYSANLKAHKDISLVARAASFHMKKRGPVWYVGFPHDGRYRRLSTGISDEAEARIFVQGFRKPYIADATFLLDDKSLYRMVERARNRCKKKGLAFGLNIACLRDIARRSGGHCEVTGHPLTEEGPFRPSLDRVNPSLGYTPDNIRIVCLIANTAMLHFGEQALLELAESMCHKCGVI